MTNIPSPEEMARRRQEAIKAMLPRIKEPEPEEDEEIEEYIPRPLPPVKPRNEAAAPLCLRATDSKECQLLDTTTNSINDTCCQDEKLTAPPKPVWNKARKDKRKPKPVKAGVKYLHLYMQYHPSFGIYSWSEAMILSEITYLMQRKEGKNPCYASIEHLASIGGIVYGTARNTLTRLEAAGVIINLGYHTEHVNGKAINTRERIIAPEHSVFPEISRRHLAHLRRKQGERLS
jgi:hypothetical protein